MLLDITIKRARLCTKSSQLFSMAEDLSQQISDSESTLNLAEYAYNWSWVESEVKTLAVLKYAYKTIHGWAEDMDAFLFITVSTLTLIYTAINTINGEKCCGRPEWTLHTEEGE